MQTFFDLICMIYSLFVVILTSHTAYPTIRCPCQHCRQRAPKAKVSSSNRGPSDSNRLRFRFRPTAAKKTWSLLDASRSSRQSRKQIQRSTASTFCPFPIGRPSRRSTSRSCSDQPGSPSGAAPLRMVPQSGGCRKARRRSKVTISSVTKEQRSMRRRQGPSSTLAIPSRTGLAHLASCLSHMSSRNDAVVLVYTYACIASVVVSL